MKSSFEILLEIDREYGRARRGLGHPPMNSAHEGYAVLLEEVDELWEAIKADDHEHARKEAVQVGAMVLALIRETLTEE